MDFNATSLYPSVMWDDISIGPKIGTAMRLHLISIIEFFENFNNQTSTQGSAI